MVNCFGNSGGPRQSVKRTSAWVHQQSPNNFGEYRIPISRKGLVVAYALVTKKEVGIVTTTTWHKCPLENVANRLAAAGLSDLKNGKPSGSHKRIPSNQVLSQIQNNRNSGMKPYGIMDDWLLRTVFYEIEEHPYSVTQIQ